MCDGPMRKPIQLELARFYVQLNRMIEAADIYREAQLWTEAAACFIGRHILHDIHL